MFDLKFASADVRKAAKVGFGISSGRYEPVTDNRDWDGDELDDPRVVARVYNRNHPAGVEITNGAVTYASMYL